MSLKLKPYPEYKDSGVPWFGDIPRQWGVLRSKFVFREVDLRSTTGKELHLSMSQKLGLIPSFQIEERSLTSESHVGGKLCEPGDVVLNRLKAHLGVFAVAKQAGIVSPDYTVFRPKDRVSAKYYELVLRTPLCRSELRMRAKGIVEGFWRLYTDDFYEIKLPFPPQEEQEEIISFCAAINGRVNRLIRAKRRLIELLSEQKQVIIHKAVTRGLDPNVRLKPSGIEWLGDVPEHWDVSRLGRLITLQRGFDITQDKQTEGEVPVVSSGGISSYHNQHTSRGPGVIVGRKGTVGSVYFVESDYWAHDTTLWVKEFNGNQPRYVYYFLQTLDLKRFDTGSANPTLNRNIVHPDLVAFAPVKEQHSIVCFIDSTSEQIERLVNQTSEQVRFLREYRTRLIADVVTGKLDVWGVELAAMDETGVMEDLESMEGYDGMDAEGAPEPVEEDTDELEETT